MYRPTAPAPLVFVLTFFGLASCSHTAYSAELLKVRKADGTESQLLQKVVTVGERTNVREAPNTRAKSKGVGPFSVFYQLKTDDGGDEENGFYRIVADPVDKDNPDRIRWVKKDSVQIWATRFAIKPTEINDETTFKVKITSKGGGTAEYRPQEIPKDAKAYSLVLKADESDETGEGEGELEVAFCVARLEDNGMNAQLNQLGEMALEIAFVIEDGEYLKMDYKDEGKEFKRYVGELAAKWAATIEKQRASGDVPVRMALISYSDVSGSNTTKTPKVLVALTDNLDEWMAGFDRVTGSDEQALDKYVDGFSGVDTAIQNAGWSNNSAKQIIVLGNSPMQPDRGKQRSGQMPFNHYLNWLDDRSDSYWADQSDAEFKKTFGDNTSGKTTATLLGDAFQLGGNQGDELRRSKYLHCIHIGQTLEQRLDNSGDEKGKGREIIAKLNEIDDQLAEKLRGMTAAQSADALSKANLIPIAVQLYIVRTFDIFDGIAQATFKSLAQNDRYDGYYTHMNPEGSDIDRVVSELDERIKKAIGLIADVARGNEKEALKGQAKNSNEMTKPIFRIVGSELSAEEKLPPVLVGTASLRDPDNGRSVGEKVVMVSKDELRRLKSTFGSMYDTFQQMRKAAARQNVRNLLDKLQKSLATAASGQELDENIQLEELITDLPLRTEALRLTAGDIAVMSTDALDSWLEDIQLAEQRSTELLGGDQERWISINGIEELSDSQLYAFLRLSELP